MLERYTRSALFADLALRDGDSRRVDPAKGFEQFCELQATRAALARRIDAPTTIPPTRDSALAPLGVARQAGDVLFVLREVVQLAVALDEEMMVMHGIGVEHRTSPGLITTSRSSPASRNCLSAL